jgi:hypothetical protein
VFRLFPLGAVAVLGSADVTVMCFAAWASYVSASS